MVIFLIWISSRWFKIKEKDRNEKIRILLALRFFIFHAHPQVFANILNKQMYRYYMPTVPVYTVKSVHTVYAG